MARKKTLKGDIKYSADKLNRDLRGLLTTLHDSGSNGSIVLTRLISQFRDLRDAIEPLAHDLDQEGTPDGDAAAKVYGTIEDEIGEIEEILSEIKDLNRKLRTYKDGLSF